MDILKAERHPDADRAKWIRKVIDHMAFEVAPQGVPHRCYNCEHSEDIDPTVFCFDSRGRKIKVINCRYAEDAGLPLPQKPANGLCNEWRKKETE